MLMLVVMTSLSRVSKAFTNLGTKMTTSGNRPRSYVVVGRLLCEIGTGRFLDSQSAARSLD
jgi:hypothetical protein